jgi:flagellar hook protein FlgE
LSGLSASAKNLDAIGNNVANAGTVGFKGAQAEFADVYAASLNGAGATQVGIGVKVAQVAQQFTQGNITSTNNPLDVAINGNGFFRMSTGGAITYSRNGQFQLDKTGYMVNATGARLTGYVANTNGILSTGSPADIQINTADLAPLETKGVSTKLNLDSRAVAKDLTTTPFNPNDPTTYTNASSVSVYDSLGNAHILQTFYIKTHPYVDPLSPTPGTGLSDPAGTLAQWDVYGTIDGNLLPAELGSANAGQIGSLTFQADGTILPPVVPGGIQPYGFTGLLIPVATGANNPIGGDPAVPPGVGVNLDFAGTTQYGSVFGVNALTQDGYASGRLSGFSLSDNGTIVGRYTNGQTNVLGQVVLSNFPDPNGLTSLGANQWIETTKSGPPLTGAPGSGGLGAVQSSAVEDSNVDLTSELVNMITAQRNYQANAQTIKTQDQVLQTLVNLR